MLAPLLARLQTTPTLEDLARKAEAGVADARLSTLDAAKPAAIAALRAALRRPMLLVTARPGWARRYADELALWSSVPEEIVLFPHTDALPYEPLALDPEQVGERLRVLSLLMTKSEIRNPQSGIGSCPLVVASVRALADTLMAPDAFQRVSGWLRRGQHVAPRSLFERWLAAGYDHVASVELPGQFAHRGGIVDVYPVGSPSGELSTAYRLEFWGDDLESIRTMDPLTQRSAGEVEAVFVPPAQEVLGDGPGEWPKTGLGAPPVPLSARLHVCRGAMGSATLLDYLPREALVLVDEPRAIASFWAEFEAEAERLRADLEQRREVPSGIPRPFLPWPELKKSIDRRERAVTIEHDPERETIAASHSPVFSGRLQAFLDFLSRRTPEPRVQTVVVSRQTARLAELLHERRVPVQFGVPSPESQVRNPKSESRKPKAEVLLVEGALPEGWRSEEVGIELFTDGELFGLREVRRPSRRARRTGLLERLLADLAEGELVVHVDHGIGRYRGLVRVETGAEDQRGRVDGLEREYLLLEYAEGDRLYVPIDQADRVARYMGGGEAAPGLTRLGSGEWTRAKQKARRAARDIAAELLDLYAVRSAAEGYDFPPDAAWQAEVEAAFPFIETPDQMAAVQDVKQDMEQSRPMDRLLVGDVGYGKTEVALRAAFKAVLAGKQVAVLVPTTVLAQQHFNTFSQRLAAFPVRVEMLSRFRSEREQRAIVADLTAGAVDICIGTHRLVQKDVRFKDLGLVIIDEEQRFGVAHKERLKQLRKEVDVLTLTATPIPRTLHMALSGVRDMSTIETAPESRMPVRTYLSEYDEGTAREAIVRELERGGQVYFVHNRVHGIEQMAARLRKLVPDARIAVAHGQMPEDQLERVMLDFAQGEIDVLVCTTIVESGLDFPNVNTLIVHNAHRFGLSQLYQLRGRVGRGAARAYAYFFYSRDGTLTETAEQRLRTIFEATELGAGFRIAMKDLEIRGAGNLLGAEQSGHIAAVGFDLYTRLLSESVSLLKATREGAPLPRLDGFGQVTLDLPVEAHLPENYVQDEQIRLNLYQRLAAVAEHTELGAMVEELEDRFGPLPEPAQNLAYLVGLRLAARDVGVEGIAAEGHELVVRFQQLPRVDSRRLSAELGVPVSVRSNQLRFPLAGQSAWMPRLLTLLELVGAGLVPA